MCPLLSSSLGQILRLHEGPNEGQLDGRAWPKYYSRDLLVEELDFPLGSQCELARQLDLQSLENLAPSKNHQHCETRMVAGVATDATETEICYLDAVLALQPLELERPNTQEKEVIMISLLFPLVVVKNCRKQLIRQTKLYHPLSRITNPQSDFVFLTLLS